MQQRRPGILHVPQGSALDPYLASHMNELFQDHGPTCVGMRPDLVCLSHLRWDFVWQRPQQLLSRAARERRVFYVEEPCFEDGPPGLQIARREGGVIVVVPHLPPGTAGADAEVALRALLDRLLTEHAVHDFILWYYTPMALGFADHLRPRAIVYDVMDELALFRFAPPSLLERETELYRRADVVFTGGASLHEAKRHRHGNVHLFPSSIDTPHFEQARQPMEEPADQACIPTPRLGFFGVIDERMDLELLAAVADARPAWQLVIIGPVVKIDEAEMPRRPNLHYLGGKAYAELPRYIAGWDAALMPWARNDATRFISPTKTPEYLAAGRPVISTPIHDVVRPYGAEGLVRIAATPAEFVAAVEQALGEDARERSAWLRRVDARLARTSWDRTWAAMRAEVEAVVPAGSLQPDADGSGSSNLEHAAAAAD